MKQGRQIVLTAPFTEMIDHAGYFIQMGMASIPIWMEWVMDKKYPEWRNVKRFDDGSAQSAPAGLRVLEKVMAQEFGDQNVVVCYPDDIDQFIGTNTQIVALSTHNPLGVTFAAGVYTSIFGSSREPINSHYAKKLFDRIRANSHRETFKVILGGSGAWQITQTNSYSKLGVDCVIDGRSESLETIKLFRQAINGESLPLQTEVSHPTNRDTLIFPDKPTTFGVVEMTTGCGRRCQFCVPDLNPQIDLPKAGILDAVRANVENGNKQISLATEDMFIWGQIKTETPFFFPNREALVNLYQEIVEVPGVEQHVLSHSTMAPAVVDPVLIKQLTDILLPKSPIHLKRLSSHPEGKAIVPLIGMETGSARMAKQVMPSKGVPFDISDWQSVMVRGLEILNANNWFPMLTLMVGNPGETDDDVKATLDLVYEIERRGLFGFLVPSVFTPLEGTRMEHDTGVTETKNLTRLQWQLIMRCWKMNMRPGLQSWWGPLSFKVGGVGLWAARLRKTNGPNFTWPMMMFCGALSENFLHSTGKLYKGQPIRIKTRAELLASIKPSYWKYLREDTGDIPDADAAPPPTAEVETQHLANA